MGVEGGVGKTNEQTSHIYFLATHTSVHQSEDCVCQQLSFLNHNISGCNSYQFWSTGIIIDYFFIFIFW